MKADLQTSVWNKISLGRLLHKHLTNHHILRKAQFINKSIKYSNSSKNHTNNMNHVKKKNITQANTQKFIGKEKNKKWKFYKKKIITWRKKSMNYKCVYVKKKWKSTNLSLLRLNNMTLKCWTRKLWVNWK